MKEQLIDYLEFMKAGAGVSFNVESLYGDEQEANCDEYIEGISLYISDVVTGELDDVTIAKIFDDTFPKRLLPLVESIDLSVGEPLFTDEFKCSYIISSCDVLAQKYYAKKAGYLNDDARRYYRNFDETGNDQWKRNGDDASGLAKTRLNHSQIHAINYMNNSEHLELLFDVINEKIDMTENRGKSLTK